jgi:hypothetical protein
MNSASTNFDKYLAGLRDRLEHPTDYEHAVTFFLEEFAGDLEFIKRSESEAIPTLTAVLDRIAIKFLSAESRLERPAVFRLNGHPFIHGNAVVREHALLFFYFPELNTGIAALIPGVRGAMEVARFQLPGGLPRPDLN